MSTAQPTPPLRSNWHASLQAVAAAEDEAWHDVLVMGLLCDEWRAQTSVR